jgi:hypothetical protein
MNKISKKRQNVCIDADYVAQFLEENSNFTWSEAYSLIEKLAKDVGQDYAILVDGDVPEYFQEEAKLIFDTHPEFNGTLIITFYI